MSASSKAGTGGILYLNIYELEYVSGAVIFSIGQSFAGNCTLWKEMNETDSEQHTLRSVQTVCFIHAVRCDDFKSTMIRPRNEP
jgi:hypothetical protein